MTMVGDLVGKRKPRIRFHFVCECKDCDADGVMLLDPKESGVVACPDGCGAGYIPWQNPLNKNRWELKNVIMPFYDIDAMDGDEDSW